MAIPSGSGSEVLKRITATGDFASVVTMLTVPALHIYTILTITIIESAAATGEAFYLSMTDADNSDRDIYLTRTTPLGANETFVWNDKFALAAGDTLKLLSLSACNFDVLISFIDQDWS